MIFKSQLKTMKVVTTWFQTALTPPLPLPFYKTPAGIGPRNNKDSEQGQINQAFLQVSKEEKRIEITKKVLFSHKSQHPPPGEMKFGTDKGRMKVDNKEKEDRMSTFPVEAAVATREHKPHALATPKRWTAKP